MFYSKKTGGFYAREIHGDNMPADVVEITAEQHAELIDGQSTGKRIIADESGRPVLADPLPPTAEQLQQQVNAEARAYLSSTDWYVLRQQETGIAIPAEILELRAEARARVIE